MHFGEVTHSSTPALWCVVISHPVTSLDVWQQQTSCSTTAATIHLHTKMSLVTREYMHSVYTITCPRKKIVLLLWLAWFLTHTTMKCGASCYYGVMFCTKLHFSLQHNWQHSLKEDISKTKTIHNIDLEGIKDHQLGVNSQRNIHTCYYVKLYCTAGVYRFFMSRATWRKKYMVLGHELINLCLIREL